MIGEHFFQGFFKLTTQRTSFAHTASFLSIDRGTEWGDGGANHLVGHL